MLSLRYFSTKQPLINPLKGKKRKKKKREEIRAQWQIFLNVSLLTEHTSATVAFPPFLFLATTLSPFHALITITKEIMQI